MAWCFFFFFWIVLKLQYSSKERTGFITQLLLSTFVCDFVIEYILITMSRYTEDGKLRGDKIALWQIN